MNGAPVLPSVRPVLDGRTPVYIEVGADPTVAPGVQVPPGSVARFGAAYYFKTGTAATDWTLTTNIAGGFNGLTGVTAPLSGAGTVASPLVWGGNAGVTAPITGLGTVASPLAMAAATASVPGYMTAAQAAIIAQGGIGWKNRTIARAVAKCGILDEDQAAVIYEGGGLSYNAGFLTNWLEVTAAGGTPGYSNLATDRGGLTRFQRSTASGTMHYQRGISGLIGGNSDTGRRYYMRFRIRLGSIAGAGAALILGLGASNNAAHASFIDVGVVAANSTTKYSARITGTTTVNLTSTVNIDTTTTRWVELYCDGTNTFLSVEDETPVSGAYVAFAAPLRPNACYISDGTAGTREFFLDRAYWCGEEAT